MLCCGNSECLWSAKGPLTILKAQSRPGTDTGHLQKHLSASPGGTTVFSVHLRQLQALGGRWGKDKMESPKTEERHSK